MTYIDPAGLGYAINSGAFDPLVATPGASVVPFTGPTSGWRFTGGPTIGTGPTIPMGGAGWNGGAVSPYVGGMPATNGLPPLRVTNMGAGIPSTPTTPMPPWNRMGSMGAGLADDVAAATPGRLARAFPKAPSWIKGAGRMGRLGPGLGAALAGSTVGAFGDWIASGDDKDDEGFDKKDAGQFLSGAGTGGGLAGGAALALGSTGLVGLGIAGAGAIGYGLFKAFQGDKKDPLDTQISKQKTAVDNALLRLEAIDPDLAAIVRDQLTLSLEMAGDVKEKKAAALEEAAKIIMANTGISRQRKSALAESKAFSDGLSQYMAQGSNAPGMAAYEAQQKALQDQMMGYANAVEPKRRAQAQLQTTLMIQAQNAAARQQAQSLSVAPYIQAQQMRQAINQEYAPIGLTGGLQQMSSADIEQLAGR